ncbi:hypothetical protein KUF83_11800 [Streptomyces sp. BV286]|uniref:hypothetical protein n=1 Tax=Streptomyces sp. BV286 TaxID=2849672 RepID=UPI001C2E14AD|nr:hypothetical protein [Streptomyces sp. BV286]MBV1937240.1 hypothetical protein [Streptomyces sp. BV286]
MYRRRVRLGLGVLFTGLLLAGCSGSGDDGTAKPAGSRPAGSEPAGSGQTTASGGPRSSPTPTPPPDSTPGSGASATSLDFVPDPGRAPKTRAEALRLARTVAAAPADWGPGFVRRSPYEADPGSWPSLDADCVWQREPLPATVLASLTRNSELPAEDGKGPVRVAAVVSVHRTVKDADWEMAGTLEETLRCPDQQLRQGERITGLLSQGADFGLLGNFTSEDSLAESGEYSSDELGGPHHYYWLQSRLGQVTVAVVGRGAEGRSADEVNAALQEGAGRMLSDLETELEAPR